MKHLIKSILVIWGVLFITSCGESLTVKKPVDLIPEDRQTVLAISDQFSALLRQKATLNFFKTCMKQSNKASFMMDYLSSSLKLNKDQTEIAMKIVNNLFGTKDSPALVAKTSGEDIFNVSPTVSGLTKNLTIELKNVMVTAFNEGQSDVQLTNNLKAVIINFKSVVQGNSLLTFDEVLALVAFAEFQNNSIADMVNMANGLNSNSGGRTQGWLSNLVSVVITAVVAAVVVVAIVATCGGIAIISGVAAGAWLGTAVGIGAVVGRIYGGVVGCDMSVNHNSYFTDFNPENMARGFLDWEPCYTNPSHWACI